MLKSLYRKISFALLFSFVLSLVSVSWIQLLSNQVNTPETEVSTSLLETKKRSVMALCSGILYVAVDYLWDKEK